MKNEIKTQFCYVLKYSRVINSNHLLLFCIFLRIYHIHNVFCRTKRISTSQKKYHSLYFANSFLIINKFLFTPISRIRHTIAVLVCEIKESESKVN